MSSLIMPQFDTIYCSELIEQGSAWHGLQEKRERILPDGSNVELAFPQVYTVGLKPDVDSPVADLPDELKADGAVDLSNYKLLMADCKKSGSLIPLHVPKQGYRIHQNRELFRNCVAALTAVLGADGFEIATIGTVGGCSQFFFSIQIKGHEGFNIGKGDKWGQYFGVNSSHDGLIASCYDLTLIRRVCFNTMRMAYLAGEEAGTSESVKHTANSGEGIKPERIAEAVGRWLAKAEQQQLTLASLKEQPMDLQGFRAFAAGVFTQARTDILSSNSWNRISAMESLFNKGTGNHGESVYDGINAFTEYFTHGDGVGSRDVSAGKRLASANRGRGNDWKLEAMRVATTPEAMANAMERGAILWDDKAKLVAAKN